MSRGSGNSRRHFLGALAATALAPLGAAAQGLSKRPVRVIVPFTPATGPDIIARLLAPRLQQRWEQPFVVENRPGASGTIGAEVAAKSPPDGHTIMVGPASAVTAPHLYPKLGYNVIRDFAPITNIGSTSLALLVHNSLPVKSVPEFVRFVKARPGQLNYGSPGNGTHHHFCMELLKLNAKLDMVHVPYKGSAGATNDLIAGHIPTMFVPIHVALPMWKSGRVRVLAQTLRAGHPLFPEIPSLHAQGVPGYDVDLWLGVWAPAGVSAEVLARYNADIRAIVAQPDMREQLASQGLVPNTMTQEVFAKLVKDEYDKWGKVIRDAKITAD